MFKKSLLIFGVLLSNLCAEFDVNIELYKNDSIYNLSNNDIVFQDDKLKFSFKTDKKENIEIFYKTNQNDFKKLDEIKLNSDKLSSYPLGKNFITLDAENGSLTFLFKTNELEKEFKFYTNPNFKSTIHSEEQTTNNRIYIDKNKIISNNRGEKESNIIIPKLESATVIVKTKEIGAGVIINDGKTILTNYHVIESDKDNIFIAFKPILGNKPANNNYYRVEVEKVDMSRDLALLKIPSQFINNTKERSLKLAEIDSLKKGVDIYNIGHPLGYYYAFEYGMLTNILNDYSWDEYKADYILQYSMNSNKGNSGSPIVNDKLELIGIGAFTNKKGENLNFGISVVDIKKFLEAKKSITVEKKSPNDYKQNIIEEGFYKKVRLAKLDRDNNGIPDAMMKDIDNDGIWDIIAYDSNEDGNWDRKTSFK